MNKAVFYKVYKEANQFPDDTFIIEFKNSKLEYYGGESCICLGKDISSNIDTVLKNPDNVITNIYKRVYNPSSDMRNTVFIETAYSGLAGYDEGVTMYREQVKGNINISIPCKIIFPLTVHRLSSSFLQGLLADYIKDIGLQAVRDRVEILGVFDMDTLWNSLI